MFTGVIEEIGTVALLDRHDVGAKLTVHANVVRSDLAIGSSIAINGVCLTAVEITSQGFAADLSPETLERTNLGGLRTGAVVNLERPLVPTRRLSGHFVQGHVDGTGMFISLKSVGDGNWWLHVRVPRELLRYFVPKGSIAIDGISLTLASVDDDVIGVAIISHTYQATTLGKLTTGSTVNLECDVLAKHVERLLETMQLELKLPSR